MIFRTLSRAALKWQADHASYLGAAIAYYALFSTAPLLILAIAVSGLIFGEDAAEGKLVGTLSEYVGPESAQAIQSLVHQAEPGSGWAAVISGLVLFLAAVSLFQQMRTALRIIWKLPPRPENVVTGTVRSYLLAFATLLVTLIFAFLLVASSTSLTLVLEVWGHALLSNPLVFRLVNLGVSVFLLTLALTFCFRLLSDGVIPYRYHLTGALVTAILFVLGKWLFGFYLASTSLRTAYGAASSLVVFLVWVYYSAQLIFFGAEVVQVLREPESTATSGTPAAT